MRLIRREQRASRTHLGVEKSLCHFQGFVKAKGDEEAPLRDVNSSWGRDSLPDVAGPAGAPPRVAARLAGDRYEAEIADRSAIGGAVALDNDHALAETGRRHGMGET
jgi:hypothetical protein